MALTTAEKNRRKRERKKKERGEQKRQQVEHPSTANNNSNDDDDVDIEIEYVPEPLLLPDALEQVRRFQERAAMIVSDDEKHDVGKRYQDDDDYENGENDGVPLSKRKIRDKMRPSVAELKRRVQRPDLVEAHDVTAPDPDFLIRLKAVPGTVPVPRHWGRKRKYLQGKRGFEKPPFQLPDFIVKTGITEVRDTVAGKEAEMSAKQKNRQRVAPKMGAIDVDYKTLYDAFFKHQTKPKNLTKFGDLYYEGKELEVNTNIQPGGRLSQKLRDALGMTLETSPPPWLISMQRYGPPPSYPLLKIPGLNAPLPSAECQYGYHPGGWGKPPVDTYGRPLYGGTPFDPPGSSSEADQKGQILVTNDGKTVAKLPWGALPTGFVDKAEESSEEEGSESEMEESEGEEASVEAPDDFGMESVLQPPPISATAPMDLRKQAGVDTPAPDLSQPKQLYQVIEQRKADAQAGTVFASEVAYVVPGATAPEGAESVLSKALPQNETSKRRRKGKDGDDEDDLAKNFKF